MQECQECHSGVPGVPECQWPGRGSGLHIMVIKGSEQFFMCLCVLKKEKCYGSILVFHVIFTHAGFEFKSCEVHKKS